MFIFPLLLFCFVTYCYCSFCQIRDRTVWFHSWITTSYTNTQAQRLFSDCVYSVFNISFIILFFYCMDYVQMLTQFIHSFSQSFSTNSHTGGQLTYPHSTLKLLERKAKCLLMFSMYYTHSVVLGICAY